MKKRNIIIYIISAAIVFLPFFYIVYAYNVSYKLFRNSGEIHQSLATAIYDRNGKLVSYLYDEYRKYSPIEQIPDTIIKAFLAAEDNSFYMHTGFDLAGIARAIFIDIASGGIRQGGSTITQQLAKQLLAGKEKSLRRKLVELFLAREFEKKFTKNQILEMYLNQIYMGHGVYGVSAAAEFFFKKEIKSIDIIEAAIIAGIPSAPEKFSPLKNRRAAHDRSLGILFNLIASGAITKEDAAVRFNTFWQNYSETTKTEFPEAGIRRESLDTAQWFVEYIRRELIAKYGEDKVYRGGLKVYTTLDSGYQRSAEEILERSIAELNSRSFAVNRSEIVNAEKEFALKSSVAVGKKTVHGSEQLAERIRFNRELIGSVSDELILASMISGYDIPASVASKNLEIYNEIMRLSKTEGALVAIDPSTGGILAMVGGSEFNPVNQLNRAVQSRRQPGSAFKAFVYGAGIEEKRITAATPFQDSPLVYRGGRKSWAPSNYDKDYSGRVLARRALSQSLNIVSAKIYDLTGGEAIAKFAFRLTGIDFKRFQLDPTLSLGTTELTPLEMAKGFAVYANRGLSLPVNAVVKIEDRSGRIIYNSHEILKPERAVSEQTAYIMTSMMQDVVNSGTASYAVRRAAGFKLPCAGKTGTNTSFRDAWFVGYTPDLVAAVWVGCESPRYSLGRGQSGASVAAPVWGSFMNEVYKTRERKKFPSRPGGISEARICSISGDIADRGCPAKNEYFIPGTVPSARCDGLHGKLSNIKELIDREKNSARGKTPPEIFGNSREDQKADGNRDEKVSEEFFFFDE